MTVLGKLRIPLLVLSIALLTLIGLSGTSAAKPPLGPGGFAPGTLPWNPGSRLVTTMLFIAYTCGALAVIGGLVRRPARAWSWWAVGILAAIALVTGPFGSGDHTNYAAYGRIAVQGGDPYSQSPLSWHGGLDPITAAVQPPWQHTPSIYGPLATSLQAVASQFGGTNLRETVWVWQIFMVAAWLAIRFLLLRIADRQWQRARVDVLWTFNPIVFGVLLLGAHVDLLAGAFALGALVLVKTAPRIGRRYALVIGMLVGAAIATKVTYGVVALGIGWAWWRLERGEFARWAKEFVAGMLLIVVPCYLVAGPHVLHQLGQAGGSFSYASPWSLLIRLLRLGLPEWAVTTIVFALAAGLMIALAWGLQVLIGRLDLARGIKDEVARKAIVTTWALATAYVLAAPYSLPWYDVLTWTLLPLLVISAVDFVLVGRHLFMALAYVPGRAIGIAPGVENWSLGFRKNVAPYAGWLALAVLAWTILRTRQPR